jgi:hypothetical protein
MRFQIYLKQILSVPNPKNGAWIVWGDDVETRDMALYAAEGVARHNGTPAKVVTVRDDADEPQRLIGKTVFYYGPKEFAVEIDWLEFEFEAQLFRVDAAGIAVQRHCPTVGWMTVRFESANSAFFDAISRARYPR